MNFKAFWEASEIDRLGFRVLPNDLHVGRKMLDSNRMDYDRRLMGIACHNIKPWFTVIDCGAMYGNYTWAFRRNTMQYGMIVCIEPGLAAFECLKANLEGPMGHIACVNGALSESHGGYLRHKITDDKGSCLVTDWDHTGDNVERKSIDGIVERLALDRVDFIHIKCQGWERRILSGTVQTIEKYRPILMIEINHEQLALHSNTWQEIKGFLDIYDYSWNIIQEELSESSPQFNILCRVKNIDFQSLMNKLGIKEQLTINEEVTV